MDRGVMSIPCCMKAPSANQRLLMMLKWFETVVPDMDSSICHSYGENLEKKYPLNSIYLFDWIQQSQQRWAVDTDMLACRQEELQALCSWLLTTVTC